jgi:hypothetical protein
MTRGASAVAKAGTVAAPMEVATDEIANGERNQPIRAAAKYVDRLWRSQAEEDGTRKIVIAIAASESAAAIPASRKPRMHVVVEAILNYQSVA